MNYILIVDVHYYPFYTGCDNARINIWNIPREGMKETLTDSDGYLHGKIF